MGQISGSRARELLNKELGMMEEYMELEKVKNEVQRKIGRNLILFQQVELMIKWLLANNKIEGYANELKSVQDRQAEAVQNKTLGQLICQYTKYNQPLNYPEIIESSEIPKGDYWTLNSGMIDDPAYFESKEKALKSLASERNELVHHLLPRLNPESIESWIETERYLDCQREKILPELTELQSMVNSIKEARKQMFESLTSDEGNEAIKLAFHKESNFVFMLCAIANKASRNDGWTSLDTAGRLIRQHAPEEIANLKIKYRHKTLKGLILATELFDISEESTGKGGVRVFYRLKHEGTQQIA